MKITRRDIAAFILGEDLPLAVTTEIERQIDDPESDVRRIARDFSKLSRLVFDPSTPLPGDPAFRWPEEEAEYMPADVGLGSQEYTGPTESKSQKSLSGNTTSGPTANDGSQGGGLVSRSEPEGLQLLKTDGESFCTSAGVGELEEGSPKIGEGDENSKLHGSAKIPAERFSCHDGSLSSISEQTATIDAQWYESGELRIRVGGFLYLGLGSRLQITWRADDGSLRAVPVVLQNEFDILVLIANDGQGPHVGDHLEVQHCWRPESGGGWDISVVLGISLPSISSKNSKQGTTEIGAQRQEGQELLQVRPLKSALNSPNEPHDPLTNHLLDCLAILWAEAACSNSPLTLSEIHVRLSAARQYRSEPIPTVVQVSENLDFAISMGLLEEVEFTLPEETHTSAPFGRGISTNDPVSELGYLAVHRPGTRFSLAYKELATSYSPNERLQAVIAMAQALELPPELVHLLQNEGIHHKNSNP